MQQTEKYQFNLIEGGDDFSPNPLNENMEKVEGQFTAVDEAMAQQARDFTAALGSGGKNCRIAYGSYTGTGKYGSASKSTLTFDFYPVTVIWGCYESSENSTFPTVAIRGINGAPCDYVGSQMTIAWTDTGLSWYNSNGAAYQNNTAGRTYCYVALGYSAK